MKWIADLIRALLRGWARSGEGPDTGLDPAVLKEHEENLAELRETKAEVEEIRQGRRDVSEMTTDEKIAALKESRD